MTPEPESLCLSCVYQKEDEHDPGIYVCKLNNKSYPFMLSCNMCNNPMYDDSKSVVREYKLRTD